eukprot:COSAG05_NODE_870_length_6849_cov_43.750519_8_plen_68_part_00
MHYLNSTQKINDQGTRELTETGPSTAEKQTPGEIGLAQQGDRKWSELLQLRSRESPHCRHPAVQPMG